VSNTITLKAFGIRLAVLPQVVRPSTFKATTGAVGRSGHAFLDTTVLHELVF